LGNQVLHSVFGKMYSQINMM